MKNIDKLHVLGFQIVTYYILFIIFSDNLKSQSQFDIFPITPGVDSQAQIWTLYCRDNIYYALGDFPDTSGQVIPWIGIFDYNGNMNNSMIIHDTLNANPFRVARNDIQLNFKGNLLIYGSQRTVNGIIQPKLIEIDLNTGNIVDSIFLYNPIDSSEGLTRRSMIVKDSLIILTSYFWVDKHYYFYIAYFNNNLEFISDFMIDHPIKNNIVFHVICENDSTITLIGDSRLLTDDGFFPSKKPFIYRLTNMGDSIYFKVFENFTEKAIGFAPAYANSVQIDDSNNWILSSVSVVENTNCKSCFYHVPYTFMLDSNFENLKWVQSFTSLSPFDFSQPLVTSMIRCKDKTGYITSGFDGYSFIYKVDNHGDSLWLRKYIPMGWSEERALWTEFVDLKETPQGNLLMCGRVSDNELDIIRPWIVQLDQYGCFQPGCHLVNSTNENESFNENHFSIYPNPASNDLFLQSTITSESPITLTLIASDGTILKSKEFYSLVDTYYLFSIEDISSGTYHLSIVNKQANIFEMHTFVKQ